MTPTLDKRPVSRSTLPRPPVRPEDGPVIPRSPSSGIPNPSGRAESSPPARPLGVRRRRAGWIGRWAIPFAAPFLLAAYPVLFHYGNNSGLLTAGEILKQLPLFAGIALGAYLLFALLTGCRSPGAANAAFVFLLFFHTYGILFDLMREWDAVRVDHFTLLPAYALLGGYAAWMVGRLPGRTARPLWRGALLIAGTLVAFNLAYIIPVEIRKAEIRNAQWIRPPGGSTEENPDYPDIYYIVFDEMTGFEGLRSYWRYDAINDFSEFLAQRGFYVAESSYAETTTTFHELAARLNYQSYPYDRNEPDKYWGEYIPAIGNSRAMQYLKARGYTTIVFNEHPVGLLPFSADIVHIDPESALTTWDSLFNDFGALVMGSTMLKPVLGRVRMTDAETMAHARRIFTAEQNVAQADVPSPKFVYVHLLIPHPPFIFDSRGNFVDAADQYDWDQYLGTYLYAVQLAETMVTRILESHRDGREAVIILQSDHGARNLRDRREAVLLKDFPREYSLLIVNAIRAPGCESAGMTQDMDPIDTFPMLFNCYFGDDIPLP